MKGMSLLKLGYKDWLPRWVSVPVFSLSSPHLREGSYCFGNSRKERLMWPGTVSTADSYQELKAHQNTRVRLAGEPFQSSNEVTSALGWLLVMSQHVRAMTSRHLLLLH